VHATSRPVYKRKPYGHCIPLDPSGKCAECIKWRKNYRVVIDGSDCFVQGCVDYASAARVNGIVVSIRANMHGLRAKIRPDYPANEGGDSDEIQGELRAMEKALCSLALKHPPADNHVARV